MQAEIQSKCHVTIAGPSTLSAILTSFQMGFHMLAIQEKGDEVWKVLEGTKREFNTFETLMGKMETQVGTVQNTIQKLGVRTRAINRTLREVGRVWTPARPHPTSSASKTATAWLLCSPPPPMLMMTNKELPADTRPLHTPAFALHSPRRSVFLSMAVLTTRTYIQILIADVNRRNEMAAVDEKVKQIIVEQLQVDEAEVTPGASFQEDLGADSLDVVELVMQFEEAFDIQIPDEDAEKIKTVKDAVDYIEKNQKAAK